MNVQNISELKKLEAQAERKNRFTVMGEMGATLAHEIRNPLGSIELFSSLLKKEMDSESSPTTINWTYFIGDSKHEPCHFQYFRIY